MLKDYPYKINTHVIPYPDSWRENPQKLANSFTTEDGRLQRILIRNSKMVIDASFTVTSFWLKKFMEYRDAPSITVAAYNAAIDDYEYYICIIDDESFTYDLIPESRYAQNTNGLYKLSFTLEEI